MRFKTQCRVREYNAGAMIHVFRDIHPTNGPAYLYDTAEQAWLACEKANDGSRTRDDYRVVDTATNKEA
jgi:hypothetical protein